jgi:cytochrome c-type biogenesis protein CcmF
VAVGIAIAAFEPTARGDFSALLLFTLAALVVGTVFQEFLRGVKARRAMASESAPVALVHLVQRNRRRYGGYVVHVGFVVLLCGVAASSSFQQVTEQSLKPGQSIKTKGYTLTYTKPVTEITRESVALGALMTVTRDGKPDGTIQSAKGFYPANVQLSVSDQFEGETETHVGLRAGALRDLWLAVEPDTSRVQPLVNRLDTRLNALPLKQLPAGVAVALRDLGIRKVANTWAASSPQLTFRVVVSPMVTWIWAGGIIVALGGLIAIWPAGTSPRRRVSWPAALRGKQKQA